MRLWRGRLRPGATHAPPLPCLCLRRSKGSFELCGSLNFHGADGKMLCRSNIASNWLQTRASKVALADSSRHGDAKSRHFTLREVVQLLVCGNSVANTEWARRVAGQGLLGEPVLPPPPPPPEQPPLQPDLVGKGKAAVTAALEYTRDEVHRAWDGLREQPGATFADLPEYDLLADDPRLQVLQHLVDGLFPPPPRVKGQEQDPNAKNPAARLAAQMVVNAHAPKGVPATVAAQAMAVVLKRNGLSDNGMRIMGALNISASTDTLHRRKGEHALSVRAASKSPLAP
mmetsp:Transcript_6228/g.21370  ORF Transcript_6228/g.21370 Transcript_6228/m.21370 type:complete len:286 (-) Transcript_6228:752-1609(-)